MKYPLLALLTATTLVNATESKLSNDKPSSAEIELLPALPKAWPECKVTGIRYATGETTKLAQL